MIRLSLTLTVLLLSIGIFGATRADAQNEVCVSLAEAAFSALESCANADGNTACYAMAAEVDGEAAFTQIGDTVALTDFSTLTTKPLDLTLPEWGMARVNVHANVPLNVSRTGLTFVLIGDATLENAVAPTDAFMPAEPIRLQTLVGANLRSFPSTDGRIVESAPAGMELLADGRNAAGDWVRVTFGETIAWVSTSIVVTLDSGLISDLPVLSAEARTPMQAFHYRNATGGSECTEDSPSMLTIQAPDGVTGNVTANGTEIQFSDTIALRTLPGGVMQLVVLQGSATTDGITLAEGFTINMQLNADETAPAGAWTGFRPISGDEQAFFSVLELMPEAGLYRAVTVPTQDEITATLRTVNAGVTGSANATVASAAASSCDGFRPTSPLDGLAFGATDFYWDGAAEATEYRVNIYRDGELARSETIDAFTTTTAIDTSSNGIGDGLSYGWNVEALVNGETVCETGTVTLLRSAGGQAAGNDGDSGGGDDNKCNWGCD